jgi:hypothetical protein
MVKLLPYVYAFVIIFFVCFVDNFADKLKLSEDTKSIIFLITLISIVYLLSCM